MVLGRGGGAGVARRAAWWADVRKPGPPHVAVLLDNVPEHHFWLGVVRHVGCGLRRRQPDPPRSGAGRRARLHALSGPGHHTAPPRDARRARPRARHRRRLGRQPPRPPGRRGRPGHSPGNRRAARRRRGRRRDLGLPDLHFGHVGLPQGMPVHPGTDGGHRRRHDAALRVRAHARRATSPCRCSTPTASCRAGRRRWSAAPPSPSRPGAASRPRASCPTCDATA